MPARDMIAYAVDCKSTEATLLWTASKGHSAGKPFTLEIHSVGCLVSTAGNTNVSLAIVTELREDGNAVQLSTPHSDGKLVASGSYEMQAGRVYEVVTALISRRDLAEPGQYRYPYEGVSPAANASVVVAASRAAKGANTTALRAEHSEFWRQFWNASSIDLGSKYELLEGWWFGMQ